MAFSAIRRTTIPMPKLASPKTSFSNLKATISKTPSQMVPKIPNQPSQKPFNISNFTGPKNSAVGRLKASVAPKISVMKGAIKKIKM